MTVFFKQIRHLKRYKQILSVLSRYGFSIMNSRVNNGQITSKKTLNGMELDHENLNGNDGGVRLRLALEELGPTFIKIGQILSTRVDLFSPEYINELSKLQDKVAPITGKEVTEIIEEELNLDINEIFSSFNKEPIAVASIGQVHQATLYNGEDVVIKVKKPDIEPQIVQDLDILESVFKLMENKPSWGKSINFSEIASEIKNNVLEELDYNNEGRNAEKLKRNLENNPNVYIPKVYWEYTKRNVLTLEYKDGYHLNHLLESPNEIFDRKELAENIVDSYFTQIFEHGFFHADPHPGNIIIFPSQEIMFVDFGTAGYISESLRNKFQYILKSIMSEQTDNVAEGIIDLGFTPPEVDRRELASDLDRIQNKYYNIPLENIEINEVLQEFINISSKHSIRMPREFLLLVKTLGTLEGLIARLDPSFKLINSLNKYVATMQTNFFSNKQLKNMLFTYEGILTSLPQNVSKISEKTAKGDLKLKIETVNNESNFKRLGKIINRLSFSVVLASVFIGFSLIVSQLGINLSTNLPVIEAVFIIIGGLGVWWFIMMIRSEK